MMSSMFIESSTAYRENEIPSQTPATLYYIRVYIHTIRATRLLPELHFNAVETFAAYEELFRKSDYLFYFSERFYIEGWWSFGFSFLSTFPCTYMHSVCTCITYILQRADGTCFLGETVSVCCFRVYKKKKSKHTARSAVVFNQFIVATVTHFIFFLDDFWSI